MCPMSASNNNVKDVWDDALYDDTIPVLASDRSGNGVKIELSPSNIHGSDECGNLGCSTQQTPSLGFPTTFFMMTHCYNVLYSQK